MSQVYIEEDQQEYFLKDNINHEEEELMEDLAEIYSIIVTLDKLEKLFLKDCIDDDEYTTQAMKLMAQYKTICTDNPKVTQHFNQELDTFAQIYSMTNCSNGIQRLKKGIPATVEHFQLKNSESSTSFTDETVPSRAQSVSSEESSSNSTNNTQNNNNNNSLDGKAVAETTGNFITLMDALKLRYNSKDQLHPLMSDLLLSVNKVFNSTTMLKRRISLFKERQKLVEWIVKINHLKIGEHLTEAEVKDMLFDLDQAYKGFYSLLS